jgi:dienelactone hydrolase
MPGYETVLLARTLIAPFEPEPITLRRGSGSSPAAAVPGGRLPVNLSGFNTEELVELPAFTIDRAELTNRAFKAFVDGGGYDEPSFWAAGRGAVPLVDITGRRGPATWEAGDFPSGRGDEPVGGVSWYEAAAYCSFRGQQLPTVYHWARAALAPREVTAPLGPSIVPLSNFSGQGPAPAGKFAGMGPYGTYDMAGNVREWTWNDAGSNRRLILGGAWNDPDYMFSVPFSLPPDDRSAANGFRCMTVSEPVAEALRRPVPVSSSDYRGARPVSDEVFQLFARQFAYVPSAAPAPVEHRDTTPGGAIREQATVDVGYGGERMRVYVFLPATGTPPYDAVIYFPALNAFQAKTASAAFYPADYVVKSGRALVLPVFKGSFERWDPILGLSGEEYLRALRVRLTEWRQDLGRTIDYLATRGDINASAVGYYGRSFGASMPLALLALEPRLSLAILYSGGFTYRQLPAETDAVNYVSRVTIPVLMLNGRHDYVLPYETSQKPLFRLLGTAPADKKHVVYDAGHDPLPRSQFVREILAWLDRYMGVPAG